MSDASQSWPALSFLEGLRPGPGEAVELALLASYSADLGSIGASLLALAGKDDDAGRGNPSDLADAVEQLRGKVRVVIQRGRLANMRRTPRMAAVLDQFVREVEFDEAVRSWHAKATLVRMRTSEGTKSWRLWIGSRNLTESMNRDLGLLLVSSAKASARIAGVDEMARALAERAALGGLRPASLAAAAAKVTWRSPPGVRVDRIRWSTGSTDLPVPAPPAGADEVMIVSPFVDATFLAQQTSTGSRTARRTLLTTMREIERVGPALPAFDDLLALEAPEVPKEDCDSDQVDDVPSGTDVPGYAEEEEIGRGLHAKLLFIRSGRRRRLWIGSANATMRAWTGRNVEAVAELSVDETLEKGLRALLGSARLVTAPTMEHVPDEALLEEEALARARAQVAARWAAGLTIDADDLLLTQCPDVAGPHPDETDILLEAGPLLGELVPWPRGEPRLHLGSVPPEGRSEFVRLRISRGGEGLSWLQRAPADPPFAEDRDRAVFVRVLGARGFLLWLAGLLAEDNSRGEGDWRDAAIEERWPTETPAALDVALPTLEEMLAAWARNSRRFAEIDRRVSDLLPAVREQAAREEPHAARIIEDFAELWQTLRAGLGVFRAQRTDR